MAANGVAEAVGRIAVGAPVNGIVEVAGPQRFRLDEFIRQGLLNHNDPRTVVADPTAGYFGVEVDERTLVPGKNARLGETRFETWLNRSGSRSRVRTPNPPRSHPAKDRSRVWLNSASFPARKLGTQGSIHEDRNANFVSEVTHSRLADGSGS